MIEVDLNKLKAEAKQIPATDFGLEDDITGIDPRDFNSRIKENKFKNIVKDLKKENTKEIKIE